MKSDSVKKGMQTAPQRSLFNALGLTKEELEKPLVAIVSSYNEIVPGHMNLRGSKTWCCHGRWYTNCIPGNCRL